MANSDWCLDVSLAVCVRVMQAARNIMYSVHIGKCGLAANVAVDV